MALTFTISDESLNSYGYVVRTSGIDLNRFRNNPVMFYMHEQQNGVIGRWDNIRIVDNKLIADATFDESDPIGKMVKEKVNKGFIRSASIGLSNVVFEDINGVKTVTSCTLNEVSIVDVPSNQNAVKLYKKNGRQVCNLSDLQPMTPEEFGRELLDILGLDESADEHDVLDKIRELKEKAEDAEKEIKKAFNHGFISDSEHNLLLKMNLSNPAYVTDFLKDKMADSETLIEAEVNKANKAGKIIFYDKELYRAIGRESGLKTLRKLFNAMPTQLKITDIMDGGKDSNRTNWGLNEYRKYAPQELKANPKLYQTLMEREKDKSVPEFGLDYYRKHNPQFLRDNPQEYQRMIDKEANNQ